MPLDFITAAKIKEAETKWKQISDRLALVEEQYDGETRAEERFRMESDIKRMGLGSKFGQRSLLYKQTTDRTILRDVFFR